MSTKDDHSKTQGTAVVGPADLAVIEHMWSPTWIFDPEAFVIHWANASALQLWRVTDLDELRSRDFSSMSETARTRMVSNFARALAGEYVIDEWTFYPDGKAWPAQTRLRPYRHEDDRFLMFIEVLPLAGNFIPDNLRMLEAVHYLPAAVSIYASDGAALVRNPRGVQLHGPTSATNARLGDSWIDATARQQLHVALERLEPFQGEVEISTSNGRVWHQVDVRLATDPVTGASTFLVVETDVTEARRTRAALVVARDEAEHANRARSAFLANMSHEIRTPLTSILGVIELMQTGEDRPESTWQLEVISESANLLMATVNDILDLTKIDSGQLHLERMPFDPRAIVEGVVTMSKPRAVEKGVAMLVRHDQPIPPRVLGDSTRVRQILLNLVSNAIKFTAKGQVTVDLAFEPRAEMLALEVADTGIGMSREQLEHVFAPFVQADTSTTRKYGGSGLGLAIARELVMVMGGDIEVDSELGRGTCFRVRLPLPAIEAEAAESNAPAGAASLRIVLAEDNHINSMIITTLLGRLEHEVLVARNGQEAVELVRNDPDVDVVLMDIHMPVMDGVTAMKAIRALDERTAGLRIIALTADTMQSHVERYLAEGFDECLAKPVDWTTLEATLAGG